jgi:hypothetical protein
MKIKGMLLTALCVMGVAACGGGTAVSPTLPSTQAQLDNLNAKYDSNSGQPTNAAVPGSSAESIKSIFMAELATGSGEIIANVVTYYQKSFYLKNAIETNTATNANGSTTITVHHKAHGLHIGDKVSVKNADQSANGIAPASLGRSNRITAVTADTYQISVQGSASQIGWANIDVAVDYLIADCIGKYNSIESAISKTKNTNRIENLEVFYTTTTVAQSMQGCAPEYFGENVTTKYYKKNADGYELVAQNVDAGDYSMVYGSWLLPSDGLTWPSPSPSPSASAPASSPAPDPDPDPGLKATAIGKLINYQNTRKLQNNGYTLVSYQIAPDTASSVFVIITLKNYSNNDVLMTTETNIYAKATTGYQLIKRQIDYNNPLRNRVEITNFATPPDIVNFAIKNGFTDAKAADIKIRCKGMLFLSCAHDYMPLAYVFE